jgi:hypothetical protein
MGTILRMVLNPEFGAAAGIQYLRDQIAGSFALTSSERSDNSG